MKRSNFYIFIGIALFVVYAIYFQWHSSNILSKEGVYTIAKIDKIDGAKGGVRVYISYF